MKILLDECVSKRLKTKLSEFEVYTVREMGWSGIKNGKLMSLCVEHGFQILLTIDKNLQFQQNLPKYSVAIVIFDTKSADIAELEKFIPSFVEKLNQFEIHKAHILSI